VIGVPDERWGETVKALVVLAPGQQVDEAALIAHCRERLAQQLKVIYSHDYWADLTSDQPISLRTYMESLIAGVWGVDWNVGQRLIRPTSKTAWPTYIRNIKGSPYIFLELK
jgi:hypothetical protein